MHTSNASVVYANISAIPVREIHQSGFKVTSSLNRAGQEKASKTYDNEVDNEFSRENNLSSNTKTRKNLRAKKRKKSKHEVALLEAYFTQDPAWSRKTVKALKPQLSLSVDQIYKWGYDRKKLLKKRNAQAKAKQAAQADLHAEPELAERTISDFNQEVDDLCEFNTGLSDELGAALSDDETPQKRHRPLKDGSAGGSFHSKETVPTRGVEGLVLIEDDPFFYDGAAEAVFYVSCPAGPQRPHRCAGRRGLFRVPSGFANMDFYTYKEEAFQDGEAEFLGELHKRE